MYKLLGTLIHDKLPEKLKKDGEVCSYATIQNEELYKEFLKDKLIEAVNAFLSSANLEGLYELALITDTLKTFYPEYATYADEKFKDLGGYDKKYIYLQIPREVPPAEASKENVVSEDEVDRDDKV